MGEWDPHKARRKKLAYWLVVFVFLLGACVAFSSFDLKFLTPETLGQTFVLAALSAVIFLGLVTLIFVILRTLARLYFEQQAGAAGSKFRSKMVIGALGLSFVPVLALFLFSYGLMNRSIDKWFSMPVEEVSGRTAAVADLLTAYAGENAQAEADSLAASSEAQQSYQTGNFGFLLDEMRARHATLQGGFSVALYDGRPEALYDLPQLTWGDLQRVLPQAATRHGSPQVFALGSTQYSLASAAVGGRGRILVAIPLPTGYGQMLQSLESSRRKYEKLRADRRLIRRLYMQLLLFITLSVLFASTWFGLYLSKQVTRPVTALAEATQAVAEGRLDHRVEVQAGDELAALVVSFNRMTSDLESSRTQIINSQAQLAEVNSQLERRTRYMETILESIPTGVLSVDAAGGVIRINAAFIRMFHVLAVPHAGRLSGLRLADLFTAEDVEGLQHMMRQAERMGTTSSEMEIAAGGVTLQISATVAAMAASYRTGRQRLGYVMVFEDLSDLLRAQKQTAWSEVARRVAHEIKNPLTPITLSAQRIRRHIARGAAGGNSQAVIAGCAETIINAAESVRKLVDEFSQLARFPQFNPRPCNLNEVIADALTLFTGRLDGITMHTYLDRQLPQIVADPDGLKRVVTNLVDNAAESMNGSMVRELAITTTLLEDRESVELMIADTGHGVTPELKEKLFLPYFSTKERGTGLGLAIVNRIVEEHHGSIRVEENRPVGTRFILELPVNGAGAADIPSGENGAAV
jgi:hypothetical protein